VYPSVEAFVEENPARALPDWPKRMDADGADFGYDWTWQDPSQPWITTIWRVSYIDALREVYAIQLERRRGGPLNTQKETRRMLARSRSSRQALRSPVTSGPSGPRGNGST